jgi:hypothetical protein
MSELRTYITAPARPIAVMKILYHYLRGICGSPPNDGYQQIAMLSGDESIMVRTALKDDEMTKKVRASEVSKMELLDIVVGYFRAIDVENSFMERIGKYEGDLIDPGLVQRFEFMYLQAKEGWRAREAALIQQTRPLFTTGDNALLVHTGPGDDKVWKAMEGVLRTYAKNHEEVPVRGWNELKAIIDEIEQFQMQVKKGLDSL